jgi:hypothetical protein
MNLELKKFMKPKYSDIPRDLWKSFEYPMSFKNTKKLRICLYANPCGGNGDIVFSTKLYSYLKKWYGSDIYIITTKPEAFLKDSVIPDKKILCLKTPGFKQEECTVTKTLSLYSGKCSKKLSKKQVNNLDFDLFFVAPWVSAEIFKYNSLQSIFSYSNAFNTFIFSAYNQDITADTQPFDFITGIGKNRLGLLYTKITPKTNSGLLKKIGGKGKYIITHISQSNVIPKDHPFDCLNNFLKVVFKQYDNISILVPKFFGINQEYFEDIALEEKVKIILYTGENGEIIEFEGGDNGTYIVRADILPVSSSEFHSLLKYSLPDILVTGNQSLTDLLSIRQDMRIYYQLMPWESSFAKELKILTKLDYLTSTKYSCGSVKTQMKKPNFNKVIKQDFRTLSRHKLDSIMNLALEFRTNNNLHLLEEFYFSSRTKKTLGQKITREKQNV